MYAIVEIKGKQYKVEKGETISVDLINAEKDAAFADVNILLLKDADNKIQVGTPYLSNVSVDLKVIEHYKDKKVKVVRYKPNAGYIVRRGHRQNYTKLSVEDLKVS